MIVFLLIATSVSMIANRKSKKQFNFCWTFGWVNGFGAGGFNYSGNFANILAGLTIYNIHQLFLGLVVI
jgi:hypothetical protein